MRVSRFSVMRSSRGLGDPLRVLVGFVRRVGERVGGRLTRRVANGPVPLGNLERLEPRVLLSAMVQGPVELPTEDGTRAAIVELIDAHTPAPPSSIGPAGAGDDTTAAPGAQSDRAIWVWGMADPIVMSDRERLDFFSFLAAPHGNPDFRINTVFMSISPQLLDAHGQRVRSFLVDAHSRGLTVDYLTGNPLWALTATDPSTGMPYNQPSIDLLAQVLDFNAATTDPRERFDGFQQDTEPYLLRSPLNWDSASDRALIWDQYTTTLNFWQSMVNAHNDQELIDDDILLGAAIPFWWDVDEEGAAIAAPANHQQVQGIVDYVALLCYDTRDPLDRCANELAHAQATGKPRSVYVGLETLEVFWKESGRGFFQDIYANSTSYYYQSNEQLEQDAAAIETEHQGNPAFRGMAYHYYEALGSEEINGETAYRSLGLAERAHAPAVLIRGIGEGRLVSGAVPIHYTAVDQNGDALVILISYSDDGGNTWTVLPSLDADGNPMAVNDGLYLLDSGLLPQGGDYLIRVEAIEDKAAAVVLGGSDVLDHSFGVIATTTDTTAPVPAGALITVETLFPTPGDDVTVSWTPFNDPGGGAIAGYFYALNPPPDSTEALFTTSLSGRIAIETAGTHELFVWAVDVEGNLSVPVSGVVQVRSDLDGDGVADILDADRDGDGVSNVDEPDTADDATRFPSGLTAGAWTFEADDLTSALPSGVALVETGGPAAFEVSDRPDAGGRVLRLTNDPADPVTLSTDRGANITGATRALTVEMWIKPEDPDEIDYIPLFFKGDLDQGLVMLLKNDGNHLSVRSYNSAANSFGRFVGLNARNDSLFDGAWHHLAMTYNGYDQTIKLFVDKQLVAEHRGGNIPTVFSHASGLRLFDAGSQFDTLNNFGVLSENSALLENNLFNGDWEANTRFSGLVDDVKVTKAALPPERLGEGARARVVGEHLFYNSSSFDDPSSGLSDADAIARDKQSLAPGDTAGFENYSSFDRGINGVMIDVSDLLDLGSLNESDFEFRMGNGDVLANWLPVAADAAITVLPRAGEGRSDRVVITWPDHTIQNQWLEVTVRPTAHTGLEEPHVFYFGNAVGETGDREGGSEARVDFLDAVGVHLHASPPDRVVSIDSRFDFNRDGMVNLSDFAIARDNATNGSEALALITVPQADGSAAAVAASPFGSTVIEPTLTPADPIASSSQRAVDRRPQRTTVHERVLASVWSGPPSVLRRLAERSRHHTADPPLRARQSDPVSLRASAGSDNDLSRSRVES